MTTSSAREMAFLREALADAGWLLQHVDLAADRAGFVRVPERAYRESSFLDHRLQVADPQPVVAHWHAVIQTAAEAHAPPAHWIFHPGHVGSTLLSRLLGELSRFLPVREPLPLRTLAGLAREQGDPLAQLSPEAFERAKRALLALLGRTFRDDQVALVKATSDCCNLLGGVLEANPESRAIWLDVDLETFLAGMLRNEARQQETKAFAQSRLRDLHELLDDRTLRLYELDIGRLTAVSWLANQGHRLHAERAGLGERILTLHFHDLLDTPDEYLAAVLAHLGREPDHEGIQRMLGSRWRGAYAKDPRDAFTPEQRYAQLAESRRTNAGSIDQALQFAESLCDAHPPLSPVGSRLRPPA